ncbi:hypothetical protein SLG_01820 [Sphingobium sp. SYK-6]|nr:hypothetical protein SLG_01820 [Sphingobium sp. SYK-6]
MLHSSLRRFITPFQQANLRRHAAYLLSLPAGYEAFDMRRITSEGARGESRAPAYLPAEGIVCCAIGHGPRAGFAPDGTENWYRYSCRYFIDAGAGYWSDDEESPAREAWLWCFDTLWAASDNSSEGAARRILWLLDHGLPPLAEAQREGLAPLCYR